MNTQLAIDALSVILSNRYGINIKIKGEKNNEGEKHDESSKDSQT